MKRKKIMLFVFLLVAFLITIIIYNDKKNTLNNDKLIIKKSYAIMIKGAGDADYTNASSIPSDLTNYHIDKDKTFCENGGTVDIVGNKLSYQTLGSDRCTVYMYYEVIPDIKMNIETPSYLLSGYTKSVSNCKGTNSTIWNNKLNGVEVSNWSDFVKCDIEFTQKTPSSSELLTTIVNNKGTSTTHGIRYQGTDPNNYVWYNDELWRIIGNIPVCLTSGCSSTENRVKLIRNDILGAYKFSDSSTTWSDSNIQKLLNGCYLGKKSSCDDYCYIKGTSIVGNCDYSLIGIDASDFYGNMIEDVFYYAGIESNPNAMVGDDSAHTADEHYNYEKSSIDTVARKVGIMYVSDFGYAFKGFSSGLGRINNPQGYCNQNWLYKTGMEWTMTISSSWPFFISHGWIYGNKSFDGYFVRPTIFLKSQVYVTSGDGSQTNPYILNL